MCSFLNISARCCLCCRFAQLMDGSFLLSFLLLLFSCCFFHSFALALTHFAQRHREGLRELRLFNRRQCGRKG